MCNTSSQKLMVRTKLILVVTLTLSVMACMISSASESVYVVNSYGLHSPSPHWSTIDKLNGSDLAIDNTVTVGYDSHNVAATPDGSLLWVTARGSNNISVVDADNLRILKIIKDPSVVTPLGIAFTPDGSRAYVASESISKVAIFDAKTYSYSSSITVEGKPSFIVTTPNGQKVYVVDYLSSRVIVIRTSDNSVVSTMNFRGHKLQDAVVSPNGSNIYVCNQDLNQIEVIRTQDDSVLIPIPMPEIYPRGIGISPDGAYLFIGLNTGVEGVVDMLRLSDDSVVSRQKIHGTPRTIVVRPNGSRIFVSDYENDKCYAFDIIGENLSSAAVVNLDETKGSRSAPIGLAVVESQHEIPQIAGNTVTKTNNSSANSAESLPASTSANKSIPGFSAFSMAFGSILLFRLLKFRR